MPPLLALSVWFVLLVLLLRYDPAKERLSSIAVWIPLVWIGLMLSRLPSQWLGIGLDAISPGEAYHEGNWLDRIIYVIVMLLAVWVIARRSAPSRRSFIRHPVILVLVVYTFLSIAWSDFPFIAFKRWFRDFGQYLMILVILSEAHPVVALETTVRRLCYTLIPLSIILVKYFPGLGRGYEAWSGAAIYQGVATTKNMLGILCLLSILFFFSDTASRWRDRRTRRTKEVIAVNVAFIGMTLWLLRLADSVTATVCTFIGCLVILALHTRSLKKNPRPLKPLIPTLLALSVLFTFTFNLEDVVIKGMGRTMTLTGRTDLWTELLRSAVNPLVGAGYKSFWLGERLELLWAKFSYLPNQAHNGYIETYLNLGLVGVCIVCAVLIVCYRRIWKGRIAGTAGPFTLALWTIVLPYNLTEAALEGHVLWVFTLIGSFAAASSSTVGAQNSVALGTGPTAVARKAGPITVRRRLPSALSRSGRSEAKRAES